MQAMINAGIPIPLPAPKLILSPSLSPLLLPGLLLLIPESAEDCAIDERVWAVTQPLDVALTVTERSIVDFYCGIPTLLAQGNCLTRLSANSIIQVALSK